MKSNYMKPYRYKIFTFLLAIVFFSPYIHAQVTIGDGIPPQDYSILEVISKGTGGLRLPQLSSAQRKDLKMENITDADKKAKAIGLTIMNTDNGCYEYWNGMEWISLCEGQSDIGFIDDNGKDVDPTQPPLPCDGGSRGPFTPKEDKQCTGISTPYTYTIISGMGMINLQVTNPSIGKFTVSVTENPTARMRTAIVRVTNNCTGKHRDLLFTQEGCDKLCDLTINKPLVNVSNGGQLCQNGAVYMYITNPNANANYIWTLNDVEMGHGIWYAATTPGDYIVYVNAIGCSNASERIKVTGSNTGAPSGNMAIYATNNGIICAGSNVQLMAFNVPDAGTLTWYKDGKKTAKTGNPITLSSNNTGTWFAVMEDGSCTSRPSNNIDVIENKNSSSLAKPVVYVNGTDVSAINSFCKGGRLDLELRNYDSYVTAVTVDWYNGTVYLGQGPTLSVTAPSTKEFTLRCVVSDNTGFYCNAELIVTKELSGNAPAIPGISGTPYICGGVPATLTAMVSGGVAYQYEWYKDGVLLSGETNQSLVVEQIGTYQVAVMETGGGCLSDKSMPVTVGISDFPGLSWSAGVDEVEPGNVKTYQVNGYYNPTKYTWTVNNGAVIENGQGTDVVTIRYPNTETTVNITVVAENHCGISDPLTKDVKVKNACTEPQIRSITMSPTGTMASGGTLAMSVTATGTAPLKYQWKRNGVNIAGAKSSSYIINNAQKQHEGTYSVVVSNTCGEAGPAEAGTISIINVNVDLESPNGRLSGIDCFDVVQVNNDNDCGRLNIRKPYQADFTKTYTYTFTSMSNGNQNLTFFIDDPEKAVESYTVQPNIPSMLANGGKYTLTVKYKQSLMKDAAGRSNDNPITVAIYALYKNGTTEKGARRFVTIKDCDCCSTVMDDEENVYTAHRFGEAGCWMTQNLRSTYNEQMWVRDIEETSNLTLNDLEKKAYYYPNKDPNLLKEHPEAGLLYTWMAATDGKSSEFILQGDAGYTKSQVQGICPEGWVLPSDFDWSELEKAIASEPDRYSTMSAYNIWEESARKLMGGRGNWGKAFISPKNIFTSKSTGGVSNTDGSGFNGLLVGVIYHNYIPVNSVGEETVWWATASSQGSYYKELGP